MDDFLIKASFLIGLAPAALLLILYGFRTNWEATSAGRAVFALVSVTFCSYALSTMTLFWPQYFRESQCGVYVRIAGRVIIALVIWNLLFVFLRAQRAGRSAMTNSPPERKTTMATWPAPLRHLVLILLATGLSWAGTEFVPWLEDQPRFGLLAATLLAALLAYVTPLVQSYGWGQTDGPVTRTRPPVA